MMRLSAALVLLVVVPVLFGQDSPLPPDQEYANKIANIKSSLADEHASIGFFLSGAGMWQWSRVEFQNGLKAITCICGQGACTLPPGGAHEKANKGLGLVAWSDDEKRYGIDPAAKPIETRNLKKGEDAERIWSEYQKKLETLGKKIGKLYFDLGAFCQKALPAEKEKADAAFRTAIEYDPANKDARTKLGHLKQPNGSYQSKEEVALRKDMKEGRAKAPKGSPSQTQTEVEKKLGLAMKKQAGEHILIQSPHLDVKSLEILIQWGEHTYALFHKVFNQNSLFNQRDEWTILQTRDQHIKYVDTILANASPEHKKLAKECGGSGDECFQDTRPLESMEDWVIHHTAQTCSQLLAGGDRHWLHEGMAFYFTKHMHASAHWACTDLRGTGPGGEQKNYSDPATWELVIREWLRTNKDPDINKVYKCRKLSELKGGDPVKAWSLVDFLATEHREKFIEYMQKLRASKEDEDEATLQSVFGWTLQELDNRWKIYARSAYAEKK